MSLSELCRLPVSDLRLSAQISAPLLEKKKMLKRQQSSPRRRHSGQTGSLHCCNTCVSAHRGRGRTDPGPALSLRPAEAPRAASDPRAVKNRIGVCAAESAAAQALCKISLTFTSALCHLLQTWREHRGFAQLDLWPDTVDWVCV